MRSNKRRLCKTVAAIAALALSFASVAVISDPAGYSVSAAMNMSEFDPGYTYPTEMRGLNAFQIVSDMGAGWNLGNSFDCKGSGETAWSNPVTTKAMIDKIAAAGFKTIRVPVTWDHDYSDPSTYTISEGYLDRVETVVNYGLANDMYVIINIHHNELQEQISTYDTTAQMNEIAAIWKQVGNRFKNYGDKLIFEVINEPRCGGDWGGNDGYYECVNKWNEAGRAAIRATGGNNKNRLVMMPTYCASADAPKIAAWKNPSGDKMVAVSIHAYLPWDFAFEGNGHSNWKDSDYTELQPVFERLNSTFISKGIPVVIGEFGACNKNNEKDRAIYAERYVSLARRFAEQDIPCVWWDNNAFGTGEENFGIFNRGSNSFTYGSIASAMAAEYEDEIDYEKEAGSGKTLSGGGSSSGWGQAVTMDGTVFSGLKNGQSICADYSSSNIPEMIIQSGSVPWCKIPASSASGGVAVWKYEDIVTVYSAQGGDITNLADIEHVFIGDTGASLTVSRVYIPGGVGHTHTYNGKTEVTLEPTAYTKGKARTFCSFDGCDEYRLTVVPKGGNTPAPALSKPVVTAKADDTSVTLSWNSVGSGVTYKIYRYNGSKYTTEASDVTGTTYTVTGLKKGTRYGFLVRACANGKMSDYTNADVVYATTTGASTDSVAAPAVTPTTVDKSSIKLSWTAVSNATYKVYSYDKSTKKYTALKAVTGTSYTVTGLKAGTEYGFLVRACVNNVWSSYTDMDVVYAKTAAGVELPRLTAKAGKDSVALSWNGVSGSTSYSIFRYDKTTGKFTKVTTVTGTAASYTVKNLSANTTYGFLVRACVNGEWSSYTTDNVVYATTGAAVSKPEFKAAAGNGKVTLTWNSVSSEATYKVYSYDKTTKKYKLLTSKAISGTSYTVTKLTNGTEYGFLVRAIVDGELSPYTVDDVKYATPKA